MTIDEQARAVILGLSGFAVGFALWLACVRTMRIVFHRAWRELWFVSVDLGIAAIVMIIAEAVFKVEAVPLHWRTVVYAVGLSLVAVGMLGTLIDFGRRDRRSQDKEET